MSDLPPADWYTDPEDESQYRYWDGSTWTEHRAPRHADPDDVPGIARDGMRGPGELLGNTFSIARRQWRGCALAALISVAVQVVMVVLLFITADAVVMGELGGILERVFDPERVDTPETEAYFRSLNFDWSPINFLPAALALLIVWVASNIAKAAVTRLALSDLTGRAPSVSDAFKQALPRVPRLMGLDIQVFLILVAAMIVVVAAAWIEPLLLILVIPALVAGVVYAIPVLPMAYVVAAVGPANPSLRYAVRLVRRRFWGSLGRMLLVMVVIFAISLVVGVPFAMAGAEAGPSFQIVSQTIQTVLGAALGILGYVAPMILYHDLGGESD